MRNPPLAITLLVSVEVAPVPGVYLTRFGATEVADVVDLAPGIRGVVELDHVVVDRVHGPVPSEVTLHAVVDELVRVAHERAVVVDGVRPVGRLHAIAIETIDTVAVSQSHLADFLDVRQLLGRVLQCSAPFRVARTGQSVPRLWHPLPVFAPSALTE